MSSSSSSSPAPKNEKASKNVEIPKNVAFKLYLHTFLILTLPLATYYLTLNFLFEDNEFGMSNAALSAAGVANIIVFSYVMFGIFEKGSDAGQQKQKQKDE